MATLFPGQLDTFQNPTASTPMDAPGLEHDVQHSNLNDAVEALEAKVGITGSAVTTSHDYKLAQIEQGQKVLPFVHIAAGSGKLKVEWNGDTVEPGIRVTYIPPIIILAFLLLLGFGQRAQAQTRDPVMVDTNAVLKRPLTFFQVNSNLLDTALGLSQYMRRSLFDADTDGIVDNSENLNGQTPAFYLGRANHTGTQLRNSISDFAHQALHQSGGSDALTGNLDAIARSILRKAGTTIGTRRAINLIEGSGITLTIADDAGNEEVDVTFTLSLPSTLIVSNLVAGTLSVSNLIGGALIGSGINDDFVDFDDAGNRWTATTIGAALEELDDSINSGVPNSANAKVHWSQLLGVPAGFADGTDDGGGGGSSPTTTRGDLIARGASADQRLAIGPAGSTLGSDGTDPSWGFDAMWGAMQDEIVWFSMYQGSATTPSIIGDAINATGTPTTVNPAAGTMASFNLQSAATIGANAVHSGNAHHTFNSRLRHTELFSFVDTNALRWFCGWTSGTGPGTLDAANPAADLALFRWDPVDAGDTNIVCITKDGTTINVVNTGLLPQPGTPPRATVISNPGSNAVFQIYGLTFVLTNNLPRTNQACRWVNGVQTRETVAKNIRFRSRHGGEKLR